jgi:hypothetical protein
MHESTLDLFCDHEADEYAMLLEEAASDLEITVDYYIEEFLIDHEDDFC